jgi:hypothetical protein
MNSGAKVRRFWRISVLNFSCRMDFFRNKSSFFSHYFRIFARKKRIKGIYDRFI